MMSITVKDNCVDEKGFAPWDHEIGRLFNLQQMARQVDWTPHPARRYAHIQISFSNSVCSYFPNDMESNPVYVVDTVAPFSLVEILPVFAPTRGLGEDEDVLVANPPTLGNMPEEARRLCEQSPHEFEFKPVCFHHGRFNWAVIAVKAPVDGRFHAIVVVTDSGSRENWILPELARQLQLGDISSTVFRAHLYGHVERFHVSNSCGNEAMHNINCIGDETQSRMGYLNSPLERGETGQLMAGAAHYAAKIQVEAKHAREEFGSDPQFAVDLEQEVERVKGRVRGQLEYTLKIGTVYDESISALSWKDYLKRQLSCSTRRMMESAVLLGIGSAIGCGVMMLMK